MPLTSTAGGARAESVPALSETLRLSTAMAGGDEAAFKEFHGIYFDRLFRYLFVVTHGDEQAARDALQETFLRVVRHIRPFHSEEAFWGWLTLLARSAATDAGRKRTRYWRMLTRYAFFWRSKEASVESAADTQLDAFLTAAMQTLEPTDRELIEGKYLRGASVRELAARFQMTEKAVESRLARARRRLRDEL